MNENAITEWIWRSNGTTNICKECGMKVVWNAEYLVWESADDRSCRQVGDSLFAEHEQHEIA